MLNQVVLVGRLVETPKVEKTPSGKEFANIKLAVPRSFKNTDGEYETDFVPIKLWGKIAENTADYCSKGDIVGVKGRIDAIGSIEVVAEKVTFLSSKKEEGE